MIDINKKYKTKCGRAVRILSTDRKGLHYPVIALVTKHDGEEETANYTKDGYFYNNTAPSEHDLVEYTPFADFKTDDKVLASDDGNTWYRRYFSHENDGVPYTFPYGATSFSFEASRNAKTSWRYCKKYDGE